MRKPKSARLPERIAEEGCDDALVGVGQFGRLGLEFIRETANAREAMESALADVRRAYESRLGRGFQIAYV
ncbi:hypothetical protein BWR59_19670 [Pseudomonas sp. Bc-h]|nr:hypothetical protein BWR59_19670 [Pseudomonas sp. Bc-h]